LRADCFELFAIVNRDVVSKIGASGEMVSAVQPKLFSIQGLPQNISQQVCAFVFSSFVIFASAINRKPRHLFDDRASEFSFKKCLVD